MGCEVYANNHEIACKAGDNKVIAEFPDVCLSPPSPPAGPVPVPYPDTSFSKDMQNGSKTVKIGRKEVMLKDQSFYKTSPLGDEAATRSFGANVLTHVITGKTYFVAWSMDVKIESQNIDRHTDLTTSNHASSTPGTPPSSISAAVSTVPDPYKAIPGGGKRDRHPCSGDTHDWECNTTSCADCWDPPCEDNRKLEQDTYDALQVPAPRTRQQRAEDFKKANNDRIVAGEDPISHTFENDTIDKISADNIEHVGYAAHCKKCHVRAELDIVTTDSVIECKYSSKGFKADQMAERIIPVAKKCGSTPINRGRHLTA
jgi:hypothetical protein